MSYSNDSNMDFGKDLARCRSFETKRSTPLTRPEAMIMLSTVRNPVQLALNRLVEEFSDRVKALGVNLKASDFKEL